MQIADKAYFHGSYLRQKVIKSAVRLRPGARVNESSLQYSTKNSYLSLAYTLTTVNGAPSRMRKNWFVVCSVSLRSSLVIGSPLIVYVCS